MNPIIEMIDQGHIASGEAPGQVCKKDGYQWPCPAINAALIKHAANLRKERRSVDV